MTGFFELFNPGLRHAREQKDFDKVSVIPTKHGGRGPLQIDLDKGTVVLPARKQTLSEQAVEGTDEAVADDVTTESDEA